jgi:hypothetical protein
MAKSGSHAKTARRRSADAAQAAPERVVVSVSIEKELVRRFDVEARRESRTRSSQIAFLMRQWIESRR